MSVSYPAFNAIIYSLQVTIKKCRDPLDNLGYSLGNVGLLVLIHAQNITK